MAEEVEAELLGKLPARSVEEAAPEGPRRPLLAVAKERPANAALVVLSPRQCQRHQDNMPFVRQAAGALSQQVGPVRIIGQLAASKTMRGMAGAQTRERTQKLMRDLVKAGAKFEELLVFGD